MHQGCRQKSAWALTSCLLQPLIQHCPPLMQRLSLREKEASLDPSQHTHHAAGWKLPGFCLASRTFPACTPAHPAACSRPSGSPLGEQYTHLEGRGASSDQSLELVSRTRSSDRTQTRGWPPKEEPRKSPSSHLAWLSPFIFRPTSHHSGSCQHTPREDVTYTHFRSSSPTKIIGHTQTA